MKPNEIIDGLRALARHLREEPGCDPVYSEANAELLDETIRELDSNVIQVSKAEAMVRVLNQDAAAYVETVENLEQRRRNLWEHLSRAWTTINRLQRELRNARYQAKELRRKLEDETGKPVRSFLGMKRVIDQS